MVCGKDGARCWLAGDWRVSERAWIANWLAIGLCVGWMLCSYSGEIKGRVDIASGQVTRERTDDGRHTQWECDDD